MKLSNMLTYIIILLWMTSIVVESGKTIEEDIETQWFQISPVGIYKSLIDEQTGETIRTSLGNPSQRTNKNISHHKSPSLELILSETGNDKFLNKKTIKHSLSDLSSLTKAKRIMGEKIISCNAIQEGSKIYFPTCPGDLVVITIAGSMKMTCNEIEKRVFFGPVTIKTMDCQQSFLFDMDCDKKQALSIKDSKCNDSEYKVTLIVISTLFGLSIVILLMVILWIIGINRGVQLDNRRVSITRKGCYYELSYNEYINGEGVKAYSLDNEPSHINMQNKMFRKHWILLLLTFLICKPIKVNSFELLETYDSTVLKYNYRIILGDSEIVNFGSDKIQREAVVHTSFLNRLFITAKWRLDIKEEYFCQWYKCEAVSACGMGILPFIKVGSLAQELFNFKNQNHSYYTCQKLQGYCTFGNGCKLIAFEVELDNEETYSVYSIGIGGSHGGNVFPPTGCIVDSVTDKSSGVLNNQLLLTNSKGKFYLCHKDLFSAKPELGMLGDLQIDKNGEFHFATDEIRCVVDHNDRAICRYGGSFIKSIETLCEDAEQTSFKLSIDIPSKMISWKLSGEAVISMKCDRKLPLKSNNGKCVGIEIAVWEVAHLDTQLLLSFRASSLNELGTYKFPDLVHMNGHTFICNGEPQFTELYDLKSLKSLGVNFTMNSIPYNSLDPIQEDHFSDSDPEDNRGVTTINKVLNSTPFWGLSTTTIIIIVIVIILLIKK